MKILEKSFTNFVKQIKENAGVSTFVKNITVDSEPMTLHVVGEPMKKQYYVEDVDGEPFIDISTILPENLLDDAIWVKVGGQEEAIADTIDIFKKTKQTTKSGYNTYIRYDV